LRERCTVYSYRRSAVLIPVLAKINVFLPTQRSGRFWGPPSPLIKGYCRSLRTGKEVGGGGGDVYRSSLSTAEVKCEWSYTSTISLHIFIAWTGTALPLVHYNLLVQFIVYVNKTLEWHFSVSFSKYETYCNTSRRLPSGTTDTHTLKH
jgi:hypothetical protein